VPDNVRRAKSRGGKRGYSRAIQSARERKVRTREDTASADSGGLARSVLESCSRRAVSLGRKL